MPSMKTGVLFHSVLRRNRRRLRGLLGLVVLLTAGCASPGRTSEGFQSSFRAVWVWDAKKYLSSASIDEFILFCRSNKVGLALVDLPDDLTSAADFVAACRSENIRVHALTGSPEMARADKHSKLTAFIDRVVDYNSRCGRRARIGGIHVDVEPYLLKEFSAETGGAVANEYVEMLRTGARNGGLRTQGLLFGADIPFWFDTRTEEGKYRYQSGGRPLFEHAIDATDYVCIMSYRNKVDGRDGIIEISQTEVDYAEKIGKHVFVGVETGTGDGIPAKTTFAQRSRADVIEAFSRIERVFETNACFTGTAIHHYGSWRELR